MNITREQFENLNQLDRIEFMQEFKMVKEEHRVSNSIDFIIYLILSLSLFFILDLYLSVKFNIFIPLNIHLGIFILAFCGMLLCIISDVIELYLYCKEIKRIKEKYF